jgi:hypothetical protein
MHPRVREMDWSLSWPNQSLLPILRKAVLHYIFMAAVPLQKVGNNMILFARRHEQFNYKTQLI